MNQNIIRPILIVIAAILGFVIYKHFNFSTMSLKDPWLDTLYIITFAAVLFFLFKGKGQSSSEVEK